MVLEIAHQVVRTARSCALPEHPTIRILFKKIVTVPRRNSISLAFPTARAGSCLVDRRAMPSAHMIRVCDESRGSGTKRLR